MKISHKALLKSGGIAYLITGAGHFIGGLLVSDASKLKLRAHLADYTFELLGTQYSLLQFHTGYSMTMVALFIFIGLLCLMITTPNKKILLTLCIGALVVAGIVLKYFALVPQILTCIALVAFVLAYWQYGRAAETQTA